MTAINDNPEPTIIDRLRDLASWDPGDGEDEGYALLREAADEIDALRGAVRSLAGWVRELDPHPSLDPCEYLTNADEMAAVRRSFAQLSSDDNDEASDNGHAIAPPSERQNGSEATR